MSNASMIDQIVATLSQRGGAGVGDLCTPYMRHTPAYRQLPEGTRFGLSHVVDERTGCWSWVAAKKPSGYGQFRFRGSNWNAHRVSYTLFVGEIPDGLAIDHLCLNKSCVNPAHLDVVTPQENTRRYAETIVACPAGHPYTSDNLVRKYGKSCRECHNARCRARQARLQRQIAVEREGPGRICLLDEDIEAMRRLRQDGLMVKDIAATFGITPKYASAVIAGSRTRRRNYDGHDTASRLLMEARSAGDRRGGWWKFDEGTP